MGDDRPCPICASAKSTHVFRTDHKTCVSSSSGCSLCLDPQGEPWLGSCSRKRTRTELSNKRRRRRRAIVVTDLSHAFASLLLRTCRPWDLRGSSPDVGDHDQGVRFICGLCAFEWAEDLRHAYHRFSRRANICPSCSALDSPLKWAQVRPRFCGAPPVFTQEGHVASASWRGLLWPASAFVHPDSIYARLSCVNTYSSSRRPLSIGPAVNVDVETVSQRMSRMCPELLLAPARSRPRWLCVTYASEAERCVASVLLKHLHVPLFREVMVRLGSGSSLRSSSGSGSTSGSGSGGCWTSRFDFGFIIGGEVRLVEVDGAQHFNPDSFQFKFVPGRRARYGAAWRRDRDKDAFVAGASSAAGKLGGGHGGIRLLRISSTSIPHAMLGVLRRWCSPEPFAASESRVVYIGEEYGVEPLVELEISLSSITAAAAPPPPRLERPGRRTRDLEQQQLASASVAAQLGIKTTRRRRASSFT